MKIGINTFLTDEGISGPVLGRALEERGFESLFVAEHSHIPVSRRTPYPGGGDLPRMYYRAYDPFVALAAIASVTDRLILGTGVTLLIQRDVIHTANEVATLDRVSDGRVVFGVGVGWNREEMENHGTDPRTRGALVDEQLAALRAIWTQDEAEFHGKFIDFDPIYAWPKPIQRLYQHARDFLVSFHAAVQFLDLLFMLSELSAGLSPPLFEVYLPAQPACHLLIVVCPGEGVSIFGWF